MNRLSREKSPYLLQHAGNPVDWYPWGQEAFDRARSADRPVFLSIGYSTCHWCHVMERESFEDEAVASLLNEHFVCVKVDREERPDIDGVYMDAAVAMTGRGGWPLTILMTADGKPFYAATYLPRESRFGMPGLLELLPRVAELWRDRRPDLLSTADRVRDALASTADGAHGERDGGDAHGDGADSLGAGGSDVDVAERKDRRARQRSEIDERTIAAAADELADRFDAEHGGFGSAPKFPAAHLLIFLIRRWHATGEEHLLEMVETTLRAMRRGGIYDHVGFGFHRYSTDERWLLPHFEKMLYDQAMLSLAYTEAALATGDREYERTALEVIEYVLRDMRSPEGGFFSAEDADTEGVEGKFYLWTMNELRTALGDEAVLAARVFSASDEGNVELEPGGAGVATGDAGGAARPSPGDRPNVLYLARSLEDIASGLGLPVGALRKRVSTITGRLRETRNARVRPARDDKVLTDWNGLMISALAAAARGFGDDRCARAATGAAEFLLAAMLDDRGRLLHRFRDGEAAITANADDYAFLVSGLLDLYDATLEPRWLEESLRLTSEFVEHFLDPDGGFYFTPDDGERLIIRKKEAHDGAIPSGNSLALRNLVRLSRVTGDARFEDAAAGLSRAFARRASLNPSAHAALLTSAQYALSPGHEVVVVGRADAADTRDMLDAIARTYDPGLTVMLRDPGEEPGLAGPASWTSELVMKGGRATAYVCRGRRCELPTTDVEEMVRALKRA